MSEPVLLRAEAVEKSFPGAGLVLGPCDLSVRRREVLAVVGPSGAGKTTLLHVLAGVLSADRGSVWFDGARLRRPSPRISVVFQEYGLFPWRTARQNVAFPLEVAGRPRRERYDRAERALAELGLGEDGDKYPHQLSGGMCQRVAIARAVVGRPDLLLLDEPMSALDPVTKRALRCLLDDLIRRTGLTTLVVTHDLTDAVGMADRVVVLAGHPGTVVAERGLDRSRSEQATINQLVAVMDRHARAGDRG
jgi:NitT/TauT family transport system ATP-binding protein